MIGIYGPAWPRRLNLISTATGLVAGPPTTPGLAVQAARLSEALEAYCTRFGVSVTPYDGSDPLIPFVPGEEPKFFVHVDDEHGRMYVDVHVTRGGTWICCKQKLDFPLLDGDEIELGVLVC